MSSELQVLSDRMERLERRSRRVRLAVAVAAIISTALLLMGQARPGRIVEANRFILRGAEGKIFAELLVTSVGPSLGMYDRGGKLRMILGVGQDGPAIALTGKDQRVRVNLGFDEEEGSFLTLHDMNGTARVELAEGIRLFDANQTARAILSVAPETAQLGFNYANAKPGVIIGSSRQGPTLMLFDTRGEVVYKRPP